MENVLMGFVKPPPPPFTLPNRPAPSVANPTAAGHTPLPASHLVDAKLIHATLKGTPVLEREFAYSNADFEHIRRLIYLRAGISLSPSKKDMVYSRLSRRLRALRLKNFASYLALLEECPEEMENFVNALTTNLTAFFREEHHFPVLAAHLLKLPRNAPVRLWCSAASTGEEAYSMAITAIETLGEHAASRISIIASDLDTQVLEKARQGVYDIDRVKKLSPERLRRFFIIDPRHPDKVKVRPVLSRVLTFQRINLLDNRWALTEPFDAIFCRNVLIYFDRQTQQAILRHFVQHLHPHGLLFVGHSESLIHNAHNLFVSQGKTVYALNSPPSR